ncbi:hypothetical protein [Rhizomonospora bruguierae]|uniref:hypothetical protein n=1 Tax=Rhizomonospora bruguierae TaxID=1581705 RepID=UPI001BCC8225|nr:hypothetical protein [Micromonospora sp. NBRC 107566]
MSGGERFGEVDVDLLADYVGGALDGAAEADAVAARIAADPAWARAHEELTAALAAVESDLADLAEATEPMPADVAARIDAALGTAHTSSAGSSVGGDRPRLTVIDGVGDDRPTARRHRRWSRWAGGSAAAAALVAIAALGVNSMLTGGASDEAATSASAPDAAPYQAEDSGADSDSAGRDRSGGTDRRLVASGTDYRRGSLGAAASVRAATPLEAAGSGGNPTVRPAPASLAAAPPPGTPQALYRLAQEPGLTDCLGAVVAAYGQPGAAVQVVDLATFEGRPAVVTVLVGGDGSRVAWVSGPDCGTPAAGADTMYTSAVP